MIDANDNSMTVFMKNLIEARKEEKEKMEEILTNPEYMDGLVERLKINTYVIEEKEGKENYTTYKDLPILYKLVNSYAQDNSLFPICHSCYNVYYLKYKDYLFTIYQKKEEKNVIYGCFPSYLKYNDLPFYIKFEDIRDHKKLDVNSINRGLVGELKFVINKLYDEGFPVHFIEQLVNNMIEDKKRIDEEKHIKKMI